MRQLFLRPPSGVLLSMVLTFLLLVLSAGRAWALPAIQFDVFFDPPSLFEGGQLRGTLYVQDSFFDVFTQLDSQQVQRDSFFDVFMEAGPVIPSKSSFFDIFMEAGPVIPSKSFFSFTGNIVGEGLGDPVYAFLPGTTPEQAIQPTDTEMIPICAPVDPCRVGFTDVTAPLYAFSNATQVGYIRARVTSVPEPGTLLLLASGLAGIAVWRKFTA